MFAFSSSSSSGLNAFLAFRIERTWCPHHSYKLGSKYITRGSSFSRAFFQNFMMKQPTFLFYISCLFLLSLEIAGQPQDAHAKTRETLLNKEKNPSSSQPIAEYLHQQSVIISGKAKNFNQGFDLVDSDDITIFHQKLTTIVPLLKGNAIFHGNKSIEYTSENTASVIASSFRNVDSAQTQSTIIEDGTSSSPSNQQIHGQRRKSHRRNCGDTSILNKCFERLPPMQDIGIPRTAQAVNTACRYYDTGINCFDSWAKNCLHEGHRQKVKASIAGAHEMFSFLCKDHKFRVEYLKHSDCYRIISPHWDDCSRQFVDGLRINMKNPNQTSFCCIRLDFLACVSKYTGYFCGRDATTFVLKMAETVIRSSIRTRYRIPEYCVNIKHEHCVSITDKASRFMGSTLRNQFLAVFIPATFFLSVCFKFPNIFI